MKKVLLLQAVFLLLGCSSLPVRRILDVYVEKDMHRSVRRMLFDTGSIHIITGGMGKAQAGAIAEQIFIRRNASIQNPEGRAVVHITLQETPLRKSYGTLNAVTVIADIVTDRTIASVFFTEETKNTLQSEAYIYAVFRRCFSTL